MAGLKATPLDALMRALGGKMVEFAGHALPVQFAPGVMKEHLHTRAAASLFDVSHMGQVILRGPDAATALEALVPVDVVGLARGRQRYGLFTAPDGGILDDLMIANRGDHLFLVVNGACAEADVAHLRVHLGDRVQPVTDRALIALQGPAAEAALARLVPSAAGMRFMDAASAEWQGAELWLTRSGYTGEDGFEISVPAGHAEAFARALLAQPEVAPAGLGARDSLRLEAGLCLYGHDIDTTTTPIEAGLAWAIQGVRRSGGARSGGFPGADVILAQLGGTAARARVGLRPEGRAPVREGAPLFVDDAATHPVGRVTSGGFGPSLEAPIAMGYLPVALAVAGTTVMAEVRGRRLPCTVAPLPFRPATYKR
jgi:aminomethyltransferase